MEIAGNQGALALQLRGGISLCRATAGTKRWEEARATLAGIYAQFEEGFGTPDLVEAKKLLDWEADRSPPQARSLPHLGLF